MNSDSSEQTRSGPSQPSTTITPPGTVSNQGITSSSPSPSRQQIGPLKKMKRTRGLGSVVPVACIHCRKKRAKCDGQKPCGRCQAQNDVECLYETRVRQSKDKLRTEIEDLRRRQWSSDQVVAALVGSDLWDSILRKLREGDSVQDISEWLGTALEHDSGPQSVIGTHALHNLHHMDPAVATATAQPASSRGNAQHSEARNCQGCGTRSNSCSHVPNGKSQASDTVQTAASPWAESMPLAPQVSDNRIPKYHGLELILSHRDGLEVPIPSQTWTSVTCDMNAVQHFLALYFCWEYPTFAPLSKEHFLHDFAEGRRRYCSSILVNALLALGCRFSTQPMSRVNPQDPYTSGELFFKESQRLFNQETDHHTLPTIQALGIMSIREASCGRYSKSWYYAGQSIQLALEMGLHHIQDHLDEDEMAVQSATFWGAFALDNAWSLLRASLPRCSSYPQLPPKPGIIDCFQAAVWVPYADGGAPQDWPCEQPSNVRTVYKCFCELGELVHQSLYILHSPGKSLTAMELLKVYTRYLNWYDQIPEVLRLGHNFTPAVLFAHMYYHFAILLLFRPLIKLRIINSKVVPIDVCSQAAEAIHGLVHSYSHLYTLRRTPSFMPYFVLTSSTMRIAITVFSANGINPCNPTSSDMRTAARYDLQVSDALKSCIDHLIEMAPCHQFAEQALNILRRLAKEWNIDIEIHSNDLPSDNSDVHVRPHTNSSTVFESNVGLFLCEPHMSDINVASQRLSKLEQAAEAIEKTLCWPFPTLGRPMSLMGKDLEATGFELLYSDRE